jgi:hypothetical protein
MTSGECWIAARRLGGRGDAGKKVWRSRALNQTDCSDKKNALFSTALFAAHGNLFL